MDLGQLRAFIETARHGSFSAAASVLGLTQPGISRQVKQLEQELGIVLIDREQRPVALTSAGEEFISSAEAAVRELETAIQRITGASATIAGSIVVAASTIPGEFFVPGILARFSARHPRVQPELLITDSAGVIEALLSEKAEVGFLGAPMAHRRLILTPFAEDEIVLVVPPAHPFAGQGAIPLSALAHQSFVERSGGSGTMDSLRRILAQQGLSLPEHRVAMMVGSSQSQLAAIEAGVGVGFVSALAIASHSHPNVVAVEIESIKLKRTLYVAYLASPLSSVAHALVDFVIEPTKS